MSGSPKKASRSPPACARAHRAAPPNSKTYPIALFLGGVDSMRGFLQDSLVPEDVAAEIPTTRRWTSTTSLSAVATSTSTLASSFASLSAASGKGGLFLDTGNVWVEPRKFDPFACATRPARASGSAPDWADRFRLRHQPHQAPLGRPRQLPLLDRALLVFRFGAAYGPAWGLTETRSYAGGNRAHERRDFVRALDGRTHRIVERRRLTRGRYVERPEIDA